MNKIAEKVPDPFRANWQKVIDRFADQYRFVDLKRNVIELSFPFTIEFSSRLFEI